MEDVLDIVTDEGGTNGVRIAEVRDHRKLQLRCILTEPGSDFFNLRATTDAESETVTGLEGVKDNTRANEARATSNKDE